MLQAEKLKTYDPAKFRPGYMSVKRNGVHAIHDSNIDMFYSRTPKEINGLERLRTQLRHVPFPLVGELTIPDVDFETASGLIRSNHSTPEAVFSIFNAVIDDTRFKARYTLLKALKQRYFPDSEIIQIEPMIPVDNVLSFDRFYRSTIAKGEEGVCWISENHVYQPGKRGWAWMKRIPMKSIEAKVLELLPGTKGKKYESSLGRIRCSFLAADGKVKEFFVGIFKGQTDEWRQKVYDQRGTSDSLENKWITVEFKDFSKYGIPTQARYKAIRWDL